MKKLTLFAAVVVFTVTGCASVPMADKTADAQAKTFTATPGKAQIYVYRNESFGAAVKMPVTVDSKAVGSTASKTFILQQVEPGKHVVQSLTENEPSVEIHAEAGKNYYVWQEVKMGALQAGSALHIVPEAEGQKGVNECKLVK